MPISPITLQRRHAELGRIRLGNKQPTGNGRTRPAKLDRFRFTSVSERYIADLATLYGGEPKPWDNGGIPSHEVITTSQTIPVIVVKGGLSQWMETWSGGGCVHRCDGQHNALTDAPCDPDDENHRAAKPTTRLSLMLPELEAIGVWRMESHGWNAAAEIPAVAELAQFVGELVPAHLNLVERRAVRDGKTSRFVVPVLDLQIGTQRLREIVAAKSGGSLELQGSASAGDQRAIEGPRPDYLAIAQENRDLDQVRDLWRQAKAAGHLTDELSQALQDLAREIEASYANAAAPAAAAPPPDPVPDEDGAIDAEVVDEPDADRVWEQVVAAGGKLGLGLSELQDEYSKSYGGRTVADATAADLRAFLQLLTTGEQVPA